MKLLFDQNLSAALVERLSTVFPGSQHVKLLGLDQADDASIWNYAAAHGFAILSKDSDFQQRSILYGAPPKVIWIRTGNCSTAEIESLLRRHSATLHTFGAEPNEALLIVAR